MHWGERLTLGAWRALADTIHMRADEFTAQGLAMTLNAMSKTPAMEATAAASVPPGGWTFTGARGHTVVPAVVGTCG
jgi:hypothetical protein